MSESLGLILFAFVAGLAGAVVGLAIWRLIFGFLPIEEPTKWALAFTGGTTVLVFIASVLQGVEDWLILMVQTVTNLLAVGICWYLWVIKAKREDRYYG